jgi:hypothetical protein
VGVWLSQERYEETNPESSKPLEHLTGLLKSSLTQSRRTGVPYSGVFPSGRSTLSSFSDFWVPMLQPAQRVQLQGLQYPAEVLQGEALSGFQCHRPGVSPLESV